MGLFRKKPERAESFRGGIVAAVNDDPPPVFFKHEEADRLKGYKPRRRASLGASSVNSNSKRSIGDKPTTAKTDLVIPAFQKKTQPPSETYIEEEIIEDDEYIIEEVIDDDEYIEEEIIEEEDLPARKITITFDEYDEMQTTLHINDYTNSEINKAWFKREDYDKMVQTAQKLVEREREGKKMSVGQDTRGLEAWRDSVAVRELKERALEAVWNEQNRQWQLGDYDVEKIRQKLLPVSEESQKIAHQRAKQDESAAAAIRKSAASDEAQRKRRAMMKVGKALGKSVKMSTRAVGKTSRVLGRTTLGVATLDGRMIKESIGVKNKKDEMEQKPRITRQPSLANRNLMIDVDDSSRYSCGDKFNNSMPNRLGGSSSLHFDAGDTRSVGSKSVGSLDSIKEDGDETGAAGVVDTPKRKAQKLKLLGLVPIPGTKKMYQEDLQRKRIEDRRKQMTRMPSWETGMSAGKC